MLRSAPGVASVEWASTLRLTAPLPVTLLISYSSVQKLHGWFGSLAQRSAFSSMSLPHQSGRFHAGSCHVSALAAVSAAKGRGRGYSWYMYDHCLSHRPPLQHLRIDIVARKLSSCLCSPEDV